MTVNEIAETLRCRDVVFNLLSHILIDVPDDYTDKLIEETNALLAGIAETTENEDFKEGFALLSGLLPAQGSDVSEWLNTTRLERSVAYTSLFILGNGSVSVYESAHRSPERLLRQDPWSEVKAFYQEFGFCCAEDKNIMEDHIASELQFMGLLSGKAAEACETEEIDACEELLAGQLRFYEEHISQWVPMFCTTIAECKGKPEFAFYAAYALIIKGFIAEDMLFLQELLAE